MKKKSKIAQWLYDNTGWFWLVFFGLFLCFMLFGCKTEQQVVERVVYKTEIDTITEIRHDTIINIQYVHDSIDRLIVDSTWVDSVGRINHSRYEYINRLLNDKSSEYQSKVAENERLQYIVDSLSNIEQKTIIEEHKGSRWWIYLVAGVGLVVIILAIRYFLSQVVKKVIGE